MFVKGALERAKSHAVWNSSQVNYEVEIEDKKTNKISSWYYKHN